MPLTVSEWQLEQAAIATVLGQMIAMMIGIWITNKKIKEVEVNFKDFSLNWIVIKEIYQIGVPAILIQSIMSFMTVFMNMILIAYGALTVSVFGIYFKLSTFIFMAVNGINNALIPIVSFNYGDAVLSCCGLQAGLRPEQGHACG